MGSQDRNTTAVEVYQIEVETAALVRSVFPSTAGSSPFLHAVTLKLQGPAKLTCTDFTLTGGLGEGGGRYSVSDAGLEGGLAVWEAGYVGGGFGGVEDG